HDFVDLLLYQPFRQQAQLLWVAAITPSLKPKLAIDFNIAYHHSQHLLIMHVDSRNPMSHNLSSGRICKERAAVGPMSGTLPLAQAIGAATHQKIASSGERLPYHP